MYVIKYLYAFDINNTQPQEKSLELLSLVGKTKEKPSRSPTESSDGYKGSLGSLGSPEVAVDTGVSPCGRPAPFTSEGPLVDCSSPFSLAVNAVNLLM